MNNGVLAAGEGRSIWVVGDRYTIKASGNDTGGAFAMIEAIVPHGNGPPPHIHSREDEAFYVLEGELQFHTHDRSFTARLELGDACQGLVTLSSRTSDRPPPEC